MQPALRAALEEVIAAATGRRFRIERTTAAGGGCVHQALVLEGGGARYFAKLNDARLADAFAAEADGLAALSAAGVRTPGVVAHGAAAGSAYLVLEHLALGHGGEHGYRALGAALARMHAHAGERFGWHRDNYIGATPQRNRASASWSEFWARERLAPQLALAAARGCGGELQRLGEALVAAVPDLLAGHAPAPALLHGDLWSGNAAFLADGTPVLFDPAVYRGDRETDLAMTELFGGFSAAFYDAYREAAPPDEGYSVRRTLYNLYHVLNHANLFGGGYAAQAEAMMVRLLAEVRG
ncbi:MAG: fructosamine kinase family protein [Burkholderiales bacterium]|nr:fructosamine kinase family protein [Burkholderiales bacterium]